MTTLIFQTGPSFYAANSTLVDPAVPAGTLRIYCARLEAYDMPVNEPAAEQPQFELLVAKAERDPRLATALLQLAKSIEEHRAVLECLAQGA